MAHEEDPIVRQWREQSGSARRMTPAEIAARAQRFEWRTRRDSWLGAVLMLVLAADSGWKVATSDRWVEQAANALILAAFVYVVYRFRRYRAAPRAAAAGERTSLEFFRAELIRQRDFSSDGWGYVLPFVPGVALAIAEGLLRTRTTTQGIVLVGLGVAVFVAVAAINAAGVRRLQREIDTLAGS